jgi:hypothetical protein
MVENQLWQMISDLLVEGFREEKQKEIITTAHISNLCQPGYQSDSFDEGESYETPSVQYDYSPSYKLYAADPSPNKEIVSNEESKYQFTKKQLFIDEAYDDLPDDSETNIDPSFRMSQHMGGYNIDTSKVKHKMEDTGKSPFKDHPYQSRSVVK